MPSTSLTFGIVLFEPQGVMRGADVRFISPRSDTSLHHKSKGYTASVLAYAPAFARTHCGYPRRDGQAELTWVTGYTPRCFSRLPTVTRPSTDRARRWL